jgi:hypothetical protein
MSQGQWRSVPRTQTLCQPLWSPEEVLGLRYRAGCCHGITQRWRYCNNPMFSAAAFAEATRNTSFIDPQDISSGQLEEMASLALCTRWHRRPGYSQVNDVVARWKTCIREYLSASSSTRQGQDVRSNNSNVISHGRSVTVHVSFDGQRSTAHAGSEVASIVINFNRAAITRGAQRNESLGVYSSNENASTISRDRSSNSSRSISADNRSRRETPSTLLSRILSAGNTDEEDSSEEDPSEDGESGKYDDDDDDEIGVLTPPSTTASPASTANTEYEGSESSTHVVGDSLDADSGPDFPIPSFPPTPMRVTPGSTPSTRPRTTSSSVIPIRPSLSSSSATPTQPRVSSRTATHQPLHTTNPDRHPPRRQPLEDCSICLEDLSRLKARCGIVFCASQCGQNFHALCLSKWHASQRATFAANVANAHLNGVERQRRWESAATCPHCRAVWGV